MENDELKMILVNGFNQDEEELKRMSNSQLQELYADLYLEIEDEFFSAKWQ